MSDPQIDELWVEAAGSALAVCGKVTWEAHPQDRVAGYGLAGHLVAACIAVSAGADGAFLRSKPKSHGTGRRLDGALAREEIQRVVCAHHERWRCQRLLSSERLGHLPIVTFATRAVSGGEFSTFEARMRRPEPSPRSLLDDVVQLRGSFVLSSGQTSSTYWETLPAAHRYAVAAGLARSCGSVHAPVGVGHGGAYLATAAALLNGSRQPLVVDPTGSREQPLLKAVPILIDDYVTTGASFRRALAAFTPTARAQAQCLSLYSRRSAHEAPGGIRVLSTLPSDD